MLCGRIAASPQQQRWTVEFFNNHHLHKRSTRNKIAFCEIYSTVGRKCNLQILILLNYLLVLHSVGQYNKKKEKM